MHCLFHPQPLNVSPLNEEDAKKQSSERDNIRDFEQAQKLFTCQHGITLNWQQARSALGLSFHN